MALAQSRGTVRCGRCDHKFDALEQLFDEWPDPADSPPRANRRYRPPVLGSKQDLAIPFGPAQPIPEADTHRGVWVFGLVLMVILTAGQVGWIQRDWLTSQPAIRGLLLETGLINSARPEPPRANPEAFQLISRDLHSHPTLAGALILNATFVNLAQESLTWPVLELTLTDVQGRPVASRRFTRVEYLPGQQAGGDLLGPKVHVPIWLEIASPGKEAVGFEINFL